MSPAHFNLTVVCLCMLVGPLLIGGIPLMLDVSDGWKKVLELIGSGIMVGAAFGVVLPEGFEALHAAGVEKTDSTNPPDNVSLLPVTAVAEEHRVSHKRWLPGTALLGGFLVMLMFQCLHGDSDAGHEASYKDCRQESGCSDNSSGWVSLTYTLEQRSVILALLIHSASDGIAVGVACMFESARLAVAVGIAMVLHKGPVALGLSAYLVGQNVLASDVWTALVMFSLTAPITALLSFYVLRLVNTGSSRMFVAACVLFSAGSFAYAACDHTLPDLEAEPNKAYAVSIITLGAVIPCMINMISLHYHP